MESTIKTGAAKNLLNFLHLVRQKQMLLSYSILFCSLNLVTYSIKRKNIKYKNYLLPFKLIFTSIWYAYPIGIAIAHISNVLNGHQHRILNIR